MDHSSRWWLRPMWLRRLVHRIYPERWTQAEIDDIHRRAHERWLALGLDKAEVVIPQCPYHSWRFIARGGVCPDCTTTYDQALNGR